MEKITVEQELALVEKAKHDIAAFEQLYEYYFPLVFGYCRNRLPDHEMTEDVVSTVFFKALDSLRKFNTKKGIRFGCWLYTTAHNTIIDYLKKNRSKRFVIIDTAEDVGEESENDAAQISKERLKVVNVLALLHERYQFVLSLKFFEEMENQRIAQVMGMREKQVPVLVFRALAAFKSKYISLYPDSEIFNLDNRYINQHE